MSEEGLVRRCWADLVGLAPDNEVTGRLAAASQLRRYGQDETIIAQEDRTEDVLLMLTGRARVVRLTANGHEIWLSDIEAGTVVGESAHLIGAPRTSAVLAAEPCKAAIIPGPVFAAFLERDAPLAFAILKILAARLKVTSDLLVDQITLNVASRLHAYLVRNGRRSLEDSEVVIVENAQNVVDMADRIHATREAASRALSHLKRRGMVKQKGSRTLLVLEPSWLK